MALRAAAERAARAVFSKRTLRRAAHRTARRARRREGIRRAFGHVPIMRDPALREIRVAVIAVLTGGATTDEDAIVVPDGFDPATASLGAR